MERKTSRGKEYSIQEIFGGGKRKKEERIEKKNVTVRADTIKGRSLPTAVRGRGRGGVGAMEGVGVA